MPKAPPIHRQHKTAARHKARDTRPTAKARGYNARWARFSRAFLRANPLCEFCLGQGVVKAATITDHDAPHRGDEELFWENTFTALCKPCHDSTKQRMESKYTGEALLAAVRRAKAGLLPRGTRRQWVDQVDSAGAVVVYGPPAAGKTTWAKSYAASCGAIVYDLDDVAEGIGLPRYGRTKAEAARAMDEMMLALSRHPKERRLVFVTTSPTQRQRKFWAGLLGAEAVRAVIATEKVCKARVEADPRRREHKAQQFEIIEQWFAACE